MVQMTAFNPDSTLLAGGQYGEERAPIAHQRIAEMERRGWRCLGPDRHGTMMMAGPVLALSARIDQDDEDADDVTGSGLADFEALMSAAIARAMDQDARRPGEDHKCPQDPGQKGATRRNRLRQFAAKLRAPLVAPAASRGEVLLRIERSPLRDKGVPHKIRLSTDAR